MSPNENCANSTDNDPFCELDALLDPEPSVSQRTASGETEASYWRRLPDAELRTVIQEQRHSAKILSICEKEWIRRHEAALAAYADRYVMDRTGDNLKDMAHELCLRTLNYRGPITSGFLRAAARNLAIDRHRQAARRPAERLEALLTNEDGEAAEVVRTPTDAYAETDDRYYREQLKTTLFRLLTDNLAEVLWLKLWMDLTTEEVAAELGINAEAARRRYSRAVQALKKNDHASLRELIGSSLVDRLENQL